MDVKRYKDFLLHMIPGAKLVSGGNEIQCRCRECPDSRDPRNIGHFYISIPKDEYSPSLYWCHKCNCRGLVTYEKLIEWNIFDEAVAIDLVNHNKNCSGKASNSKFFDFKVYNIINGYISDSDISRHKLKYINDRLGTTLTYMDLIQLKVVINLYDLLNYNNITKLTRDKSISDQLNDRFIGFLSIDGAFLNMRRTCIDGIVNPVIDKRYINYKIVDKFDTTQRFYTIPSTINFANPSTLKIHIAEGPFDILSIYLNLRHREPGIYTSIAGSNYLGQIMYFITTFKIPYAEVHIYGDNDDAGSSQKMRKVSNFLRSLNFPFYIHRNLKFGEKDFGVPLSNIEEGIIQMN